MIAEAWVRLLCKLFGHNYTLQRFRHSVWVKEATMPDGIWVQQHTRKSFLACKRCHTLHPEAWDAVFRMSLNQDTCQCCNATLTRIS